MKNKKIISSALASVIAISALGSMNSSALLTSNETISEQYNTFVENLDIPISVAADVLDVFSPAYNVKNVWLRTESTSQWSYYVIEIATEDFFIIELETLPMEREQVLDELRSKLGYEQEAEVKITPYDDGPYARNEIKLYFTGEDHELNYMISEKAYSIVKDMYTIKSTSSQYGCRYFLHTDVQSCFPVIEGYTSHDGKIYDELQREMYNSVDQEMLKEKYNASLTETGFLEFSDGYTEADKLGCFKYFKDNYNTSMYIYWTLSSKMFPLMEADFSTEEINYLEGDANCDGQLTIADAATVLQTLGNSDKYTMSRQGSFNADLAGDGLTTADALAIQKKLTGSC